MNIIAQPSWGERQFETVRQWAVSVPEIVHLTVATPYPGTETWLAEASQLTTRDYRLFDIQHAVLPTRLPLERFYQELVRTQQVLNRKHLGWAGQCHALLRTARLLAGPDQFRAHAVEVQFGVDPARQLADHHRKVQYHVALPEPSPALAGGKSPYVHQRSTTTLHGDAEMFQRRRQV